MKLLPDHHLTPVKKWGRREFVYSFSAVLGVSVIASAPLQLLASASKANKESFTVQEVINIILKSIPGAPFKQTVDTIKAGDPGQTVTGIVTTMFATVEVIEKAAALGANFIIAHEPTFYNHPDDTGWLHKDEVYQNKKSLLDKHKIVVWRCHDYIHAHQPDGVMMGNIVALGWEKYADPQKPYLINLPAASLSSIIDHTKSKLGIKHLRFVGNKNQQCSKIVFIPGSAGGKMQINAIASQKPDLLIVGEVDEWETSEYVRDLRAAGKNTSLLVLGHIVSEEQGMEWLAKWLQPQVGGIKVQHIAPGDAFDWA